MPKIRQGKTAAKRRPAANSTAADGPQLRGILDSMLNGCQLIGRDWRYLYLNDSAVRHNRRPREEMLGRTMQECYPGLETTPIFATLRACMESDTAAQVETKFTFPDGGEAWFEVSVQPVPEGIFIHSHDVTDRHLAEQRLRRLMRTYAVLSEINQLLVRERDPSVTLGTACRIAVEQGGFLLAWAGLTNTPSGSLRLAAHAGATPDTTAVLESVCSEPAPGCAVTVEAIRTGRRAVCNDIASDPRAGTWRAEALERGYRAMASFPFNVKGSCAGVLNLYAGDPDFFDTDELRLLDELAMDIGFAIDVSRRETEQREAEAALRESEQLLAMVQHAVNDGLWDWDVTTGRQHLSPRWKEIVGYGDDELSGTLEEFLEMLHPEDRPKVKEAVRKHTAKASRYAMEFRLRHKDGGYRWVLSRGETMVDAAGKPIRMVGAMSDITERRQAEQGLLESEERFRQMAENIDEVFWMTDVEKQRMLYVSPAYERIWGRPVTELYRSATAWVEALHAEDRARVREAALTKQAAGTYAETYRIVRPDGNVRWILDRAFPVRDAEGRVYRIVGVAEDVTERKKLEEQMLHAQRVEAIGTLAGGMAHDLNNILAPVLMMMGILRIKLTEASDRQLIDLVESSVQRGAGIINQLLLFSRRVAGERLPVDARLVVREMVGLMREIFPRGITIVDPEPGILPPVLADATQLHQVLMNLCVNARDAMPVGGTLTLSASGIMLDDTHAFPHPEARPGRYVVIGVQDTGQGIPKSILSRIFDPFFTTKEPGKGTGLGLSSVAGIVRNHGGFMTVYTEEGQGSHFKVYLPAAESATRTADTREVAAPSRGHGETILVVDDENPIVTAEQYVLEQNGYRVLTAPGGKEAVHCYLNNQDRIRLVVTDLMMPGMDGMTLARSLRTINPSLGIIATTGLDREEKREALAALGITDVLTKPCLPSDLLEAVRRNLDR